MQAQHRNNSLGTWAGVFCLGREVESLIVRGRRLFNVVTRVGILVAECHGQCDDTFGKVVFL